jgi:hypothetical protein
MVIKILCNKLMLGRATSQLTSCTKPSRAGSLFSRDTKTCSARARSEHRAGPSRAELLRALANSSSSSFFSSPIPDHAFHIVYNFILRPKVPVNVSYLENMLVVFLRTFGRRRPPIVALTVLIYYNNKFRLRCE